MFRLPHFPETSTHFVQKETYGYDAAANKSGGLLLLCGSFRLHSIGLREKVHLVLLPLIMC